MIDFEHHDEPIVLNGSFGIPIGLNFDDVPLPQQIHVAGPPFEFAAATHEPESWTFTHDGGMSCQVVEGSAYIIQPFADEPIHIEAQK